MNICLRVSLNVHGHCVQIRVQCHVKGRSEPRWSWCIAIISLSANFRNILQGQRPPVTFLCEKLVQSVELSYLYHCCWYSSQSSKEGSWWIFGNSRAEGEWSLRWRRKLQSAETHVAVTATPTYLISVNFLTFPWGHHHLSRSVCHPEQEVLVHIG